MVVPLGFGEKHAVQTDSGKDYDFEYQRSTQTFSLHFENKDLGQVLK